MKLYTYSTVELFNKKCTGCEVQRFIHIEEERNPGKRQEERQPLSVHEDLALLCVFIMHYQRIPKENECSSILNTEKKAGYLPGPCGHISYYPPFFRSKYNTIEYHIAILYIVLNELYK